MAYGRTQHPNAPLTLRGVAVWWRVSWIRDGPLSRRRNGSRLTQRRSGSGVTGTLLKASLIAGSVVEAAPVPEPDPTPAPATGAAFAPETSEGCRSYCIQGGVGGLDRAVHIEPCRCGSPGSWRPRNKA